MESGATSSAQTPGMFESNTRLGNALAEMQKAGRELNDEKKDKDENWW